MSLGGAAQGVWVLQDEAYSDIWVAPYDDVQVRARNGPTKADTATVAIVERGIPVPVLERAVHATKSSEFALRILAPGKKGGVTGWVNENDTSIPRWRKVDPPERLVAVREQDARRQPEEKCKKLCGYMQYGNVATVLQTKKETVVDNLGEAEAKEKTILWIKSSLPPRNPEGGWLIREIRKHDGTVDDFFEKASEQPRSFQVRRQQVPRKDPKKGAAHVANASLEPGDVVVLDGEVNSSDGAKMRRTVGLSGGKDGWVRVADNAGEPYFDPVSFVAEGTPPETQPETPTATAAEIQINEDDDMLAVASKISVQRSATSEKIASVAAKDPLKVQPPVIQVADHPLAEYNGLYRVQGHHDGRWFRYKSDRNCHLYHYTPMQGLWAFPGPAPPEGADASVVAQYAAASNTGSQWFLNDAFEPKSHLSDSSIMAAAGVPMGRHIWRYAEGGRWRQSAVRTTAVDQWQVLRKVDCRSDKDAGARKIGEFWKDDVLDVIGDAVENRDGMPMVQILSKPRKSAGKETVRGGWVPVAPKGISVSNMKKRYLRKLGEREDDGKDK